MDLKSLLVDSKTTWVEFPGLDGFEVELANLSRKELIALRKRCTQNKFNRKTRAFEEVLDDDKFIKEFTEATVKSWKGLKLSYLEDLVLVELGNNKPNSLLPYTDENAQQLVENSNEFDNWLNEVVFDLEHFRSAEQAKAKGQVGVVPKP
jgi:hypothetical protein|tara:strand:- start:226 stop:675 length:450 start_codon:yes stop_codon:yes gene_type:complete